MITADQIIIHAIGDYVLQSDWMANEKTKRWFPAFCHALIYSIPFWFLIDRDVRGQFLETFPHPVDVILIMGTIFGTHYLIDRYRLARYVVWAKNWLSPRLWWKRTEAGWASVSNQDARSWLTWHEIGKPGIFNKGIEEIQELLRSQTPPFSVCSGTGYPPDRPAWLAVWLLIFADNILHICINGAALKWL